VSALPLTGDDRTPVAVVAFPTSELQRLLPNWKPK